MLLTACEKGLVDGVADVAPAGQAANSVLLVRTRSDGSAGGEATVAYPVTVYVFSGEECRAVHRRGRHLSGMLANLGHFGQPLEHCVLRCPRHSFQYLHILQYIYPTLFDERRE